jgi:hypothetical protein
VDFRKDFYSIFIFSFIFPSQTCAFTDAQSRVFVVHVTPSMSDMEKISEAGVALENAKVDIDFHREPEDDENRRGNFQTLMVGLSMGGGQMVRLKKLKNY